MSATTIVPESCVDACAPVEMRDDLSAQLWEEHGWSLSFRQTAVILLIVLVMSAVYALVR